MFEKIKELIVESLGIEEDQVTMEASFKEDLKVDSLDLFEMVMSLEQPSLLPLFPKPVDLESLVRAVHLLLGWKNRFIK